MWLNIFYGYNGKGDSVGLQTGTWDNSAVNIVSEITDILVNDFSFNIVLCTEVLEHVPDPRLAIKEMARILKPGGS